MTDEERAILRDWAERTGLAARMRDPEVRAAVARVLERRDRNAAARDAEIVQRTADRYRSLAANRATVRQRPTEERT